MKKILITLTTILTIFCCETQRDQIAKFIFDNSKITDREVHFYEYSDNGKIKTDKSIRYTFMNGVLFDSTLTFREHFYYKNHLIKIIDATDSSEQIYQYDHLDSLIGQFSINQYGDTTRLLKTEFENGRVKKTIQRALFMKLDKTSDLLTIDSFRTYDTIFSSGEHIYISNSEERLISKDLKGNLIDEHHYFTENKILQKTVKYSFLGDTKYISETTYFNYNNKSNEADIYSIDVKGDTISFSKTIIDKGLKVRINHFDYGNLQDVSYYNDKGQEIGRAAFFGQTNTKTFYKFSYDNYGNVLEEISYREKVK